MHNHSMMLRADDTRIVDPAGKPVVLRGCNLGNWLLLEMWMMEWRSVHDQHEMEETLRSRFGDAECHRLMEVYRENWISARDFDLIPTFGFNVVRVPFNCTLLEDDSKPYVLKPDAFKWLDHALAEACRVGLYVILDMHGVPGGQSVDHTTGRRKQNKLWTSEEHQKRTAWLWKEIATHFKDEPRVAAYDVINEPFGDYETPQHLPAMPGVFDRIYRSIRSVDSRHLVFIPGARQGIECYGMPADHGWDNVGFTEHYYPGLFGDKAAAETHDEFIRDFLPARQKYMRKARTPMLIGEFNAVLDLVGGGRRTAEYFRVYGDMGWAATMWCYKLADLAGGVKPERWWMVKNRDPLPVVDPLASSMQELEAFFRHLGTMPYVVNEDLRSALTAL